VTCRCFEPADFAQLYAIEEECCLPQLRFSREYMRLLTERANTATWIAEDQGRMAGFAIVGWRRGRREIQAYIETIEVAEAMRGMGFGGQLLQWMETSARQAGAKLIWLHVVESNTGAIRIYEAHGFQKQGREENFYPDGSAALIYAKTLAGMQSHEIVAELGAKRKGA
jgi:ribosomal protein S18 acetylase RimI-like enzyme